MKGRKTDAHSERRREMSGEVEVTISGADGVIPEEEGSKRMRHQIRTTGIRSPRPFSDYVEEIPQ